MSESISIFLPTRKGSQRVKNKNTKPFGPYAGGLLEMKLTQLVKVNKVDEIILSTNDEECIRIGETFSKEYPRLKIIRRPDELASSTTNLMDLVKYVPTIAKSSHILWTHVTSPFVTEGDYEKALALYFENLGNGYDSLMSVKKFQNFLWSEEENDIINRVTDQKWPQTQDLRLLYEIDSAVFLASKSTYLNHKDRIGERPFLYKQEEFKSFDIDWEDDFEMGELILKNILK